MDRVVRAIDGGVARGVDMPVEIAKYIKKAGEYLALARQLKMEGVHNISCATYHQYAEAILEVGALYSRQGDQKSATATYEKLNDTLYNITDEYDLMRANQGIDPYVTLKRSHAISHLKLLYITGDNKYLRNYQGYVNTLVMMR